MDEKRTWELYPLRIPSGWTMRFNSFCEVDPATLTDEELLMFSEDMLWLTNEHRGVQLDLGWYGKPGYYGLEAHLWFKDKEQMRESLFHPLAEFTTRSPHEVAQTINSWLAKYSDIFYKLPKLKRKK